MNAFPYKIVKTIWINGALAEQGPGRSMEYSEGIVEMLVTDDHRTWFAIRGTVFPVLSTDDETEKFDDPRTAYRFEYVEVQPDDEPTRFRWTKDGVPTEENPLNASDKIVFIPPDRREECMKHIYRY